MDQNIRAVGLVSSARELLRQHNGGLHYYQWVGISGVCIEKDERVAATWEVARDDCASDKKRLPEPGEWKFACNNGTGINSMTDDFEWASNFGITTDDYVGGAGIVVPKMGNGACKRASFDFVAWSTAGGAEASLPYRCVR